MTDTLKNRIFITGGAGFIGSRLVKTLSPGKNQITVFDNLHPQVHGTDPVRPDFPENVTFIKGDVADAEKLQRGIAASKPNLVFHLAAETGTGQSYDEPRRYNQVNVIGTTNLIEALRKLDRSDGTCRVVLAGSRAVYGEGAYTSNGSDVIAGPARQGKNLAKGLYSPIGEDGGELDPIPTPESLPPNPASVYASTKLMQEFLLTQCAVEGDYEAAILRFQNVYGPGQSLRNPYTGVLSIFSNQILQGQTLNIFEDGQIVRDFVFVDDVVEALRMAGFASHTPDGPINIGSGYPATILETAQILLRDLGASRENFRISGDFRPGDIRYAVANVERARELLGWHAKTSLADGLSSLAQWAKAGFDPSLDGV